MKHIERQGGLLDAILSIPEKLRHEKDLRRKVFSDNSEAHAHLNALLFDELSNDQAKAFINKQIVSELSGPLSAEMVGDNGSVISDMLKAAQEERFVIYDILPEKVVDGEITVTVSGSHTYQRAELDWGRFFYQSEWQDVIAVAKTDHGTGVVDIASSTADITINDPNILFGIFRRQETINFVTHKPYYVAVLSPNGVQWLLDEMKNESRKALRNRIKLSAEH